MKVFEIIDDAELIQQDIKKNKGKAVPALIRGAKRKSNGVPRDDNEIAPETNMVSD